MRSATPTTEDSAPDRRQRWVDIARGIGIVLVVYGHAWRGLVSAHLLPDAGIGVRLDVAIYAFHMPLFFLLAGLHLEQGVRRGRGRFILNRVKSVAYPYILWSLIQGTLQVLLAGKTNQTMTWHDVASIGVRPIGQFWFLYALFLCQVVFALAPPGRRRETIGLLAIAAIIVTTRWGSPNMLLTALYFLPFVAMGVMFPARWRSLDGVLAGRAGIAFAAVMAALAALALIYAIGHVPRPASYLVALLGIGATLLLSVALASARGAAVLAILGQASMAIFVMHTIVSAGLRVFMVHMGIDMPALILVTTTIGGLIVPLICSQLAALRGWTLSLGLGTAPRPR